MSKRDGCPRTRVTSFTSLELIFSKAQSAVPRRIRALLPLTCALTPSCPCLQRGRGQGFHGPKEMPEGKPEELRCKTLDRDYTKEIQPFCPDASKVMRLGDDSCHRWRAHIHSMSRDLADKMIHPPKKAPLKKVSPFRILGKKRKKMMVMMMIKAAGGL